MLAIVENGKFVSSYWVNDVHATYHYAGLATL